MEERTLELLRTLQTAERTEAGFAGVQALLSKERPGLQARDDRATLADASELLEVWAEAAPAPIAASALALAADVAERDLEQRERANQLYARCLELVPEQLAPLDALQRGLGAAGRRAEFEPLLAAHAERLAAVEGHDPELLAQLLRRLGGVRDAASDLAGAIAAYERALEHSADPELVRDLAEAYARRNAPGDGTQAADLFMMLAEVFGPPESDVLVARALDLAPGHLSALTMLEAATPEAERDRRLVPRWERFVASSDDDEAVDLRRPALARAYLAAGRAKDALACIGPLVDRGDAAAAELQAECLGALRASEIPPPLAEQAETAKTGEAHPREPTLVGFRLPRPSSAPPEAEGDEEPLAAGVMRKPDSGVHKRPAQTGGTLVGFRLPPETIAALKAQDAAEASMRAQAEAMAAKDKPKPEAAPTPSQAKPLARVPLVAQPAERPRAEPAAKPAAHASATPVLTPAEHAARLRRSSSGSIPAPAPAPAAAAQAAQAAAVSSAASVSSISSPSVPPPRPSSAPALSPAQLAQTLRASTSTPPPAHSSSELAAATAAAQHAAALRRSSPGSIPAPAPRAPVVAPSAAIAPLAAASAHAAALRRSTPAGVHASASAATARNLPEEEIIASPKPALSAVQPVPAEDPEPMPTAHAEEADGYDASAPSAHDAAGDEAASDDAASADTPTDGAPTDYAGTDAESESAAGAQALDPSAYEDPDAAPPPTPSTPPSAFAVAPNTIPSLPPSPLLAEAASRGGGSRRLMAIGAAAVVGIGAVIGLLASGGKDKPAATAAAEGSTSSAATATTATAAALPAAAPPVTAAAPPAAAAPSAAPGATPGTGLPGAVAAPTAGAAAPAPTPAGTTPTEAAAAAPTQDEKSLGKVQLDGAAHIKGGGKLRPKDVADAVREQLPAIERCYTETLEDKPSAEGGLTFGFTVGKTGKPTAVKKLSGTLKDATLARCTADALGDAQFDKLKKPAKVTVPLRFAKR